MQSPRARRSSLAGSPSLRGGLGVHCAPSDELVPHTAPGRAPRARRPRRRRAARGAARRRRMRTRSRVCPMEQRPGRLPRPRAGARDDAGGVRATRGHRGPQRRRAPRRRRVLLRGHRDRSRNRVRVLRRRGPGGRLRRVDRGQLRSLRRVLVLQRAHGVHPSAGLPAVPRRSHHLLARHDRGRARRSARGLPRGGPVRRRSLRRERRAAARLLGWSSALGRSMRGHRRRHPVQPGYQRGVRPGPRVRSRGGRIQVRIATHRRAAVRGMRRHTLCGAGETCFESLCARFCCDDGDCAGGRCAQDVPLALAAPVGICVQP